MLEVGDSFILQTEIGEHLHVVIAESSPGDSAIILMVYISSANIPKRDTTTILKVGEHPFITKESWVRYQNIFICPKKKINGRIIKMYGKVEGEVLERIQNGILESKYVSKGIKDLYYQWKMDKIYRSF